MRPSSRWRLPALVATMTMLLVSTWGVDASGAQDDGNDDPPDHDHPHPPDPGDPGDPGEPGEPPDLGERPPGEQETTIQYGPYSLPAAPDSGCPGRNRRLSCGPIRKFCFNSEANNVARTTT
jgi:hypothetical protein